MLDIKWIRSEPHALDAALARRGAEPISDDLLAADEARRETLTQLQEDQARRNDASKAIGKAKASGDEETATALIAEVAALKSRIPELEAKARTLEEQVEQTLLGLPNVVDPDIPKGEDEEGNLEVRSWGGRPDFGFPPKLHYDLGPDLGMDFDGGTRLAGARFTVLRRSMAALERALGQFMLDMHTREHGYEEVSPPALVRSDALFGTGQLPKFEDDLYRISDGHWLIPTAEVSLTNLVREMILDAEDLPIRMTALTPCFRSEAGAAGRDQRGMFRQHQFWKVELVSITPPEQSNDEHERMTACAENVLKALELPYRVVSLCDGDIGFSARKTYDLEVWLPGQGQYREISSCSNCGDFQARRMRARFRGKSERDTRFVHTLNGSGLAVGRTLIAILENFQTEDGGARIPTALQPYLGGREILSKDN
ncbi:MAG: serine--tRNA ligase [Pseudomonadota bacterium]